MAKIMYTEAEKEKFKKEDKRLNNLKQTAYDLGVGMHSAMDMCRATLTGRKMKNGHRAEIIMAFMLGFFKTLVEEDGWGEFIVSFSDFLDRKKVDFIVTRFGWHHKIQLKFNSLKRYDLPKGVHLVRTAPSRKYRGVNHMNGEIDRGDNVLLEFLSKSDVCTKEELYDFFDEHESFAAVCREAWELIHD